VLEARARPQPRQLEGLLRGRGCCCALVSCVCLVCVLCVKSFAWTDYQRDYQTPAHLPRKARAVSESKSFAWTRLSDTCPLHPSLVPLLNLTHVETANTTNT
jgi:hypothetical protein